MKQSIFALAMVLTLVRPAAAQPPLDWKALQAEAVTTLQAYLKIDTSNPPGNVGPAVDLLAAVLKREGIPFERFESAPGRSILMARLKGAGRAKPILLLHHTDVVPADRSRWTRDPFGGEIADGAIWGRGAMDMKGIGVAHLYPSIALTALYRALETAVKRKHPEAIVAPIVIPFGTDANGFRPHGVKSYGFFPAVLPAAAPASMHGDAEFIPVDALGSAIEIFFETLRSVGG